MREQWIDVSSHNGKIDWPKAAAQIRGAVLRAGYGNSAAQADGRFSENIRGAVAAGLKVAVYWFGYPDSERDARAEWTACKQVIEPYRKEILFVAYDYEYESENYYQKRRGTAPARALINNMANAFLGAAAADGWTPVLYLNQDYRKNVYDAATLASWRLWLADYSGREEENASCAIRQTSSTGKVPGISGSVDMDTVFLDFSKKTIVEIDTTMDLSRTRGQYYTVKTVCSRPVALTAGTGGVVTVVPFPKTGNTQLFALVAVGDPGTAAGIYTAAPGEKPLKRFVYKVV